MNGKKVRITESEIVSDTYYTFKKIYFDLDINGKWDSQFREVFDRGDGATILLYNKKNKTVILTRQFRIPTYLNGNESGMMIEAAAGSVEKNETPDTNIIKETEEETGYKIIHPRKIFQAYMSPAAVTEMIHFYIAEYDEGMKSGSGGGNQDEHEHIEVLEMNFTDALEMVDRGEIKDAKTIMLLQYAQINNLLD